MRKYRLLKIFGCSFWQVLLVVGLFGSAALGILGPMPEVEQLESQTPIWDSNSSADGVELGKYYLRDNRTPITYKGTKGIGYRLNRYRRRTFLQSFGNRLADFKSFVLLGQKGGASTITQHHGNCLWACALEIRKKPCFKSERMGVIGTPLHKKRIDCYVPQYLRFWCNADGDNARIYFDKTPGTNIQECAMLVGM